jgi:transcriptional regulator with XRE-family HTH domain
MRASKDQSGKQTSELPPGDLERRKLLAKLSEFVADSDLSIPRIAQLMGVSGATLTAWISGTAKPQRNKLLEIRRFLDSNSP